LKTVAGILPGKHGTDLGKFVVAPRSGERIAPKPNNGDNDKVPIEHTSEGFDYHDKESSIDRYQRLPRSCNQEQYQSSSRMHLEQKHDGSDQQ
jgi:hypothetical protein